MKGLTNIRIVVGSDIVDAAIMSLVVNGLLVDASYHEAVSVTYMGGQVVQKKRIIIEGITLKEFISDIAKYIENIGGYISAECSIRSESRKMLEFARRLQSNKKIR